MAGNVSMQFPAMMKIKRELDELHRQFRAVGFSEAFWQDQMNSHKHAMISDPRCDWEWAKRSLSAIVAAR